MLFKSASKLMILELSVVALGVVSSVLTARLVGVEGYGQLGLVAGIAGMAAAIGRLASSDAIVRAATQYPDRPKEIFGIASVLGVLLSIIATAAAIAYYATGTSGVRSIEVFCAGIVAVPAIVYSGLVSVFLQTHGRAVTIGWSRVAAKVVPVLGLLIIVGAMLGLTGKIAWGSLPAWAAMALASAGWIALTVVVFLDAERHVKHEPTFVPSTTEFWPVLRFSLIAAPGTIALFALMRWDLLYLPHAWAQRDPAELKIALGLYAAALAVGELLMLPGYALSMVWSPRIVQAKSTADAAREVSKLASLILLVSVPAVLVVLAVPEFLLTLLGGPQYAAAAPALRWLAPGLAVWFVYLSWHQLSARSGWMGTLNMLPLAGWALEAALMWRWVPTGELADAARARTISILALVGGAWAWGAWRARRYGI